MMIGLQMFNEMESLHREMDQLLCGLGLSLVPEPRSNTSRVKVDHNDEGYRVEASLPGIDIDKLEINVLGKRLSLSAEMVKRELEEGAVWHRRERKRETFRKTLMLPEEIDSGKVEAEYKNGVLSIVLPEAASVLPKKISVKAG